MPSVPGRDPLNTAVALGERTSQSLQGEPCTFETMVMTGWLRCCAHTISFYHRSETSFVPKNELLMDVLAASVDPRHGLTENEREVDFDVIEPGVIPPHDRERADRSWRQRIGGDKANLRGN